MKVLRVLRDGSTRNQSTADYSRQSLFVYENRYYESILTNPDAAALTAEEGLLVMRDANNPTGIVAITAVADLDKVIGVLNPNGSVELAQNETISVNYAHKGDIDGGLLVLPDTVTLNTVVGDQTLKDLLTSKGFVILNVTELTKFDN